MSDDTRLERGMTLLDQIHGGTGQAVLDSLSEISTDFARLLFEFPFGDVYSRPGLGLRDRELITITALAAMGNAQPQLEVHIQAGLNVGLTRDEIIEALIQIAVYAGFPAALNGLEAAKAAFAAHESKESAKD